MPYATLQIWMTRPNPCFFVFLYAGIGVIEVYSISWGVGSVRVGTGRCGFFTCEEVI